MEVGVLFSRRGNFICFLDNDYYNDRIYPRLVGQKPIKELYATSDEDDGAIKRLEDEIRQELLSRSKAIGATGIAPHDLKIGPIQLPVEIENGLRVAYQRIIHTEMVAAALGTFG